MGTDPYFLCRPRKHHQAPLIRGLERWGKSDKNPRPYGQSYPKPLRGRSTVSTPGDVMNKMTIRALVVTTTAALGFVAASTAYAGSQLQGPLLSGIALRSLEFNRPLITAVVLPSGETVNL